MSTDAFGIEKESLEALLREASRGAIQLPEFQRGWVWPRENITALLASISQSYPCGTLMMLRTGGDGIKFKQRPVEGVQLSNGQKAERLLLDGQQRITSLYQAILLGKPVVTQDVRKRRLSGWFYVDMGQALASAYDREDAFRFIPEDRVIRNFRGEVAQDFSTPEKEYSAELFPMACVFDSDDWFQGYSSYWNHDAERTKRWLAFQRNFIRRFQLYHLPVIELGKETPKQAVCQVFEKVNTGGVSLTVFELLTATFAADDFDLRKDWADQRSKLGRPEYRILQGFQETDLLQLVTLLATRKRNLADTAAGKPEEQRTRTGCRRADILSLTLKEYQEQAPAAIAGLKEAARFLHSEHFFDPRFLPYGSQLVPLAALFAVLGKTGEAQGVRERVARWFWCGIMGELYGGTTETRFARDVVEVPEWAKGNGDTPRTIIDAVFSESRLWSLRTRNSAAYKGIYTLLLRNGARDWRTGQATTVTTYFDDAVDIHHVFPKKWCTDRGLPVQRYDSIVNKTPLTARTNRQIGARAPSVYRERVANSGGISLAKLDESVSSHLAPPDALWSDDFDGFLQGRARMLLELVAGAMGKAVVPSEQDPEGERDLDPEEEDSWDENEES